MNFRVLMWSFMLCSVPNTAFRLMPARTFTQISIGPFLHGAQPCSSTALHMAETSSRRLTALRRHYGTSFRGNKEAAAKQYPAWLKTKSVEKNPPKKSAHVPPGMRRKASERVVGGLPPMENRRRKREGIAKRLATRDNAQRRAAAVAQKSDELTTTGSRTALETDDVRVDPEFSKRILQARKKQNWQEIAQIVQEYSQASELPFNHTMAAFAIKSMARVNATNEAMQLVPTWHSLAIAEPQLDVKEAASIVRQFCKSSDPTNAVNICKLLGLNTNSWQFDEPSSNAHDLASATLPNLFFSFCHQGNIHAALQVTKGMIVHGVSLDDATAATCMRHIVTMASPQLLLNFFDIRKQLGLNDTAESLQMVAGRFASNTTFVTGAVSMQTLPPADHPEIAFIGRSNVGKSTLINTLISRRNLAHVSNTPGKTQQFNYYLAGPHTSRSQVWGTFSEIRRVDEVAAARSAPEAQFRRPFYLVDLPGVGYAKVSRLQRKGWFKLLSDYIRKRPTLQMVCHLMDSRRGPQDADVELMKLFKEGLAPNVTYVIVLTKTDKRGDQSVEQTISDVKKHLHDCNLEAVTHQDEVLILPVSSEKKNGLMDLWRLFIERVVVDSKK